MDYQGFLGGGVERHCVNPPIVDQQEILLGTLEEIYVLNPPIVEQHQHYQWRNTVGSFWRNTVDHILVKKLLKKYSWSPIVDHHQH